MNKILSGIILSVLGLLSVYFFFSAKVFLGIVFLVVFALVGTYLLGVSEEKKEAANKTASNSDSTSAFISGDADFETAKKMREKLLNKMTTDEESDAFNIATDLLLNKDFIGSIQAYEKIIEKYPHKKGECIGQIGVAEFFLGNYEKALENYIESKNCGEDSEMTEDNIWEVCELMHKNGTRGQIEKYISLYPQGKFIKKANKLLS